MNRTVVSSVAAFLAVVAISLHSDTQRVAVAGDMGGCGGRFSSACWGGRCCTGRRCWGVWRCGGGRCCVGSRCYSGQHNCSAAVGCGCQAVHSCAGCYGCGGVASCSCDGAVWYDRPVYNEPEAYYEPSAADRQDASARVSPVDTGHIVFRTGTVKSGPVKTGTVKSDTVPFDTVTFDTVTLDTVTFDVVVPHDARVFINGRQTSSGGVQRRYYSRGLRPGMEYEYELQAEVIRDGRAVRLSKTVTVRAGQATQLALQLDPPKIGEERLAKGR